MSLPDGSRNNKVVEQEHLFFFFCCLKFSLDLNNFKEVSLESRNYFKVP